MQDPEKVELEKFNGIIKLSQIVYKPTFRKKIINSGNR